MKHRHLQKISHNHRLNPTLSLFLQVLQAFTQVYFLPCSYSIRRLLLPPNYPRSIKSINDLQQVLTLVKIRKI